MLSKTQKIIIQSIKDCQIQNNLMPCIRDITLCLPLCMTGTKLTAHLEILEELGQIKRVKTRGGNTRGLITLIK